LSLIDLFVGSGDDVEDFPSYVSFHAADCFEFGVAFSRSAGDVFRRSRIQSQAPDCNDMKSAVGGTATALKNARRPSSNARFH